MLADHKKLDEPRAYDSPPGTIDRIFEWHAWQSKDASGQEAVCVPPPPPDDKKKRSA